MAIVTLPLPLLKPPPRLWKRTGSLLATGKVSILCAMVAVAMLCACPPGIQDCVLRGQISEALKLVRRAYPGILDSNKQLLFKLKCRQFVEMIGGCDRIVMETVSLSCSSELGSSTDGTPPPGDVATPPSRGPSVSPNANDSAGSVFDNGEVSVTPDSQPSR